MIFPVISEILSGLGYVDVYESVFERCVISKNEKSLIIAEIAEKISFFADNFPEINLDRFLIFFFNNSENISKIIENIKLSLKAQEEYANIVFYLSDYVFSNSAKSKLISIFPDKNCKYKCFDENNKEITYNDNTSASEDNLMKVLLDLLPIQIVIHKKNNFENQNFIRSIKQVFGNRVSYSENPYKMCEYLTQK